MRQNWLLKLAAFSFVVFLVWLLALLTLPPDDPCDNPQADISAAVIADQDGDQEALVNRAIILRGDCQRDDGGEQPDQEM